MNVITKVDTNMKYQDMTGVAINLGSSVWAAASVIAAKEASAEPGKRLAPNPMDTDP